MFRCKCLADNCSEKTLASTQKCGRSKKCETKHTAKQSTILKVSEHDTLSIILVAEIQEKHRAIAANWN